MNETLIQELQYRIRQAVAAAEPLHVRGSGSKAFCLPSIPGTSLDVTGLRGIVDYQPTELVVTVQAGTPLAELQETLAAENQMLGFEPPAFAPAATVGGTVACGLSGPRRPFAGALRDFVLGVRCLNGQGDDLSFGGQVMKNVAGYDVARLMAGARGSLGVLLEISFKVLPCPPADATLCQALASDTAVETMNRLAAQPLPLSAAAYVDNRLYIRFSGAASAVETAVKNCASMQTVADGDTFWMRLREQQLDFFTKAETLWRLSLPATAATPAISGDWLIDWGGALRWLRTDAPADAIHATAAAAGGYALLFKGGEHGQRLPFLPAPLLKIHQRLKLAFDPAQVLNRGVLYTQANGTGHAD